METRSVELPTGVRLEYVRHGERRGPLLLMLHGLGDSWRSFEQVLDCLPASMDAIALSQRGFGDSDRPASGYRISDFASDVAAFMDVMELEPAIFVGHSFGSFVARKFAEDHPERVLGLVLGSSCATLNDDLAQQLEETFAQLSDPLDPAFVREFQASTLAQPIPEEFFEMVVQESLKVPVRVWREAVHDARRAVSLEGLDRIDAPTLIIWGDRDNVCGESEQEALVRAMPRARLVSYSGAGHALHWEAPERFAADLVAFASSLNLQRSPDEQLAPA